MPTIPPSFPPRSSNDQQVNFIRALVNFSDNANPAIQMGCIPLNSFISQVLVEIITTFNATTSNPLTVGTSYTNANELVSSTDAPSSVAGVVSVARGLGTSLTQTTTPPINNVATAEGGIGIFVKYAPTGGAATQGQARIMLAFVPPNP